MIRSGLLTRTDRSPACTSAAGVFGMRPRLAVSHGSSGCAFRLTGLVDPRLRAAVDTSVAWYDDVFVLHGLATRIEDGLWWAVDPPPPWHSGVKTTEPEVGIDRVLAAHEDSGVADSFGDLDLRPHGFT